MGLMLILIKKSGINIVYRFNEALVIDKLCSVTDQENNGNVITGTSSSSLCQLDGGLIKLRGSQVFCSSLLFLLFGWTIGPCFVPLYSSQEFEWKITPI